MGRKSPGTSHGLRTILVATVAIFFLEAFGYVWVRSQCHLTIKALAAQKLRHRDLAQINKQLKVELALLTSPRKLEKRAREELNLQRPTPEQTLHIK